jgi:hypothetical protein
MEEDIEIKKKEITNIELIYGDKEDLVNLASKEEFVNFILKDSLASIEEAINDNLGKVELFNIFNLSLIVELERSKFVNVLQRIIKYYEEIEDYNKCIDIQKLISKI